MSQSNPHTLSRKAKFWIGLSLAMLLPCLAVCLLWLVYLACFPHNPRLVVNSIRLAGHSGYWSPADPDERQQRIDRLAGILRISLGRTPLFSGEKDQALEAMAFKLRAEIPELERADIRRVLPDQLIFELHERIPVADLGGGFYLDDEGIVLDKSSYHDLTGTLPALSYKRDLSHLSQAERDAVALNPAKAADFLAFKRGELLTDTSVRTVLNFIRLTRLEFSQIRVRSFYISHDFIQCDLFYKNDPGLFSVQIPLRVEETVLRDDVFGRLLPKLDSSVRNHEDERSLDLRFKDRIIAKKRN